MKMYKMNTIVYFGENTLDILKQYKSKTIFIVTDPFLVESKMISKVTEKLIEGTYQIFSQIVPDPPIEVIAKGIDAMMKWKPQVMIAVGGGSTIDAGKAMLYFANKIENTEKIPFIAIPTTSGTGSEVTSFAVVSDSQKEIKYPLVSEQLQPDIAILETEFVKSVPKGIVADTGMDVLTHAIEAYVSTKANAFTDALAEKSVQMVFQFLLRSYRNAEDVEAKEKMHQASCMAGIAFNETSLGLNHAMAHKIGAKYHVSHGRINSILLTAVILFNSNTVDSGFISETAKKYEQLANIIGCKGATTKGSIRNFIRQITSLQKRLEIPRCLEECSFKPLEMKQRIYGGCNKKLVQDILEDPCILTNPRPVREEDILCLYEQIIGNHL